MTTETEQRSEKRELPKTSGRRWLVWEDDSPLNPSVLLTAAEAAAKFLHAVTQDSGTRVEIQEASDDEIDWALDDYEKSTHDLCDGTGNLALPVGDARLWNPNRPQLGWACPPSLHFEPDDEEGAEGDTTP